MITQIIYVLLYVLFGLIACFCVGLFIYDSRVLTVVRLIVGLLVLLASLRLFNFAL